VSMSGHQTGFVVAIVGEQTWQSLSPDQQQALQDAVSGVRDENRQCLEDAEQTVIDEWSAAGTPEVVDDVDRDAFSQQAEDYFAEELTGDKLALYEQVREIAP
jgi:TRAP-type transport system periplasmic protein